MTDLSFLGEWLRYNASIHYAYTSRPQKSERLLWCPGDRSFPSSAVTPLMLFPIKVLDIDLAHPLQDLEGLESYGAVQALVRLVDVPLGYVTVPVHQGQCTAEAFAQAIISRYCGAIVQRLVEEHLRTAVPPDGIRIRNLSPTDHAFWTQCPLVTVAVCTRDRTDNLRMCLSSLQDLDYPRLDRVVIDNAPLDDGTERLVRGEFPEIRYVQEPRPGLDWARNRAIAVALGEIIAYTDDDVIVDRGWVRALAQVFVRHPQVMAVTGLVVPAELETKAQVLFESYGGFGRGFEQRWFYVKHIDRNVEPFQLGAGAFGTGANMAYRHSLFTDIGGFDPALDVGTVTNGGGDLEMFFRLLHEGHTLVYEPRAIVRHRHRKTYSELRTQLTNHGIGLYAYFCRCFIAYPALRVTTLRMGLWWLWFWNVRRPLRSLIRCDVLPRELMMQEFVGSLLGALRYPRARRGAERMRQQHRTGDPELMAVNELSVVADSNRKRVNPNASAIEMSRPRPLLPCPRYPVAVRYVELTDTISDIAGLERYCALQIYVMLNGELLGKVLIDHVDAEVSSERIRQSVSKAFGAKLLAYDGVAVAGPIWARAIARVSQKHGLRNRPANILSFPNSVSIVIATRDRPDDLMQCLTGVSSVASRCVDIVVVDNNPASGLTPPIVKQFPAVTLIEETRRGSSYARNTGVKASTGDIIVMIDDDVTVPPDWLERLLVNFTRPEVMVVTGNVLPMELETKSQVLFETYGGLGRGFERFEADRNWLQAFRSAPRTWILGATANVAFRADVFQDQRVGLFEEALGAGMAGVGEDTYMFYRILQAGYTLVYEPSAFVRHKHRRDARAFRRQIYDYSKGHVAYHLTTLFRDRDLRVILYLFLTLPRTYLFRTKTRLLGRSVYPLSMLVLEIMGNLAGPWTYFFSRWKARRTTFGYRSYDVAQP